MNINLEILSSAYLLGNPVIENLHTRDLVPNMLMRRRLTRASKIVIELASLLEIKQSLRIVCGSAFGELEASAAILNSLKDERPISPTDFQNSVYNTAASYLSILTKNQCEIMTLSCGDSTSKAVLKSGAIKATDGDTIALFCFEAISIPNIEKINHCIDYLECGVALLVRHTSKEASIQMSSSQTHGIPNSISHMLFVAQHAPLVDNPILEVKI